MNFLHNDLGTLSGDEVVEVTLDKAANVKLMDSANFSRYRAGARHEYFGGYVTGLRSGLLSRVPAGGMLRLISVDMPGLCAQAYEFWGKVDHEEDQVDPSPEAY